MKSLFPGYYRPTDDEFNALWAEAIFSFDTNVLLNLYRLDQGTAHRFLAAFRSLAGRVWLPYQVAKEFVANRVEVIRSQLDVYQAIRDDLKRHADQFKATYSRHPFIPVATLHAHFDAFVKKVGAELELAEKAHADTTHDDPVSRELDAIFGGSVGDRPTDDEHDRAVKECERRFAKGLPPGEKDKKKGEERQYGDALLWLQLVENAKKTKKPVVLVTDDAKTDWWLELHGKKIGPRPELAQEMHEKAGVAFYLYRSSQFIERMVKDTEPDKATVVEAVKLLEEIQRNLSENERTIRDILEEVSKTPEGVEFVRRLLHETNDARLMEEFAAQYPAELVRLFAPMRKQGDRTLSDRFFEQLLQARNRHFQLRDMGTVTITEPLWHGPNSNQPPNTEPKQPKS